MTMWASTTTRSAGTAPWSARSPEARPVCTGSHRHRSESSHQLPLRGGGRRRRRQPQHAQRPRRHHPRVRARRRRRGSDRARRPDPDPVGEPQDRDPVGSLDRQCRGRPLRDQPGRHRGRHQAGQQRPPATGSPTPGWPPAPTTSTRWWPSTPPATAARRPPCRRGRREHRRTSLRPPPSGCGRPSRPGIGSCSTGSRWPVPPPMSSSATTEPGSPRWGRRPASGSTDLAVTPGTSYTYRVIAVDGGGQQSAPSDELVVATLP